MYVGAHTCAHTRAHVHTKRHDTSRFPVVWRLSHVKLATVIQVIVNVYRKVLAGGQYTCWRALVVKVVKSERFSAQQHLFAF